jgi:hypothetical protein
MAARETELLSVSYFHVVFTLPSAIGNIAYHNKAVIYDLLFTPSAETMLTIATEPKHGSRYTGAKAGRWTRPQLSIFQCFPTRKTSFRC